MVASVFLLWSFQDEIIVDGISIVKLLSQPAAMEAAGLVSLDSTGQPILDFTILQRLLSQWFETYRSQRGQQGTAAADQARAAVLSVFRYAQQQNAHALLSGAQVAVVHAWRQTVEIMFTKNYSILNQLLSGQGPELLHFTLRLLLQQQKALAARGRTRLAELLAGCCRVLLSKLQELGSSGEGMGLMDPMNRVSTSS
jgi:nuclear pore complex protein Nup205